jgi:hypothetical protein
MPRPQQLVPLIKSKQIVEPPAVIRILEKSNVTDSRTVEQEGAML